MERTPNFGLYKPGTDDFINIDDLNANMDIIDTELKKASGGGATPVNAIAVGHIAAAPIMGDFSVVEEE